jgi:hypothetical protein
VASPELAIPVVVFGPAGESGRPAFMSWPAPGRPGPSQDLAADDDDEELSSPLFIAFIGVLIGFLTAFVLSEVGRWGRAHRSAESIPTTGDLSR